VPALTYVGNHGFEIEGPGISFRHDELELWRAALEQAAEELDSLAVAGAHVERKGGSVAFHVRAVPDGERRRVVRQAEAVLRRRRLRVTPGKALVEGRPPVPWDKGHAVLHVLVHRHGAEDRKSTRLNSSHDQISYAVFCLKKKNKYKYLSIALLDLTAYGFVLRC